MLVDLTVREILERVASGDPLPGGGSTAALAASLAAGLAEMVARLTVGRKGDAVVDQEMNAIIDRAHALRTELIRAVDGDSDAYMRVMDAYRLPKSTEEEKRTRTQAIQAALKEAALVPLSVAKMAVEVLELAGKAVREGNKNAVTDALAGALMARSAALAAVANVRINIKGIKDAAFVEEAQRQTASLEKNAMAAEETIRNAAAPHLVGAS